MSYNPADLRLPGWLLRLMDFLVAVRLPVGSWRIGLTRPGLLLISAVLGIWGAALYSGNNLLYLSGSMLSMLLVVALWQGCRLLRSVPALSGCLPAWGVVDLPWSMRCNWDVAASPTGLIELAWAGALGDTQQSWRMHLRSAFQQGKQSQQLQASLQPVKRGVWHGQTLQLSTAAPLGLWQISLTRHEAGEWPVLPKAVVWGAAFSGDGYRMRRGGDEWGGLRDYVRGDALNRVHWRKATLPGQWPVKTFEQPEASSSSEMLRVDLRMPAGQQEAFEQLLGRAWHWLENRMRYRQDGVLVIGQQQWQWQQGEVPSACLKALAGAAPESEPPAGLGGMLLSMVDAR